MVGAPIGTKENAVERAVGAVQEGRGDSNAHGIADMPDKQSTALIITECLEQIESQLPRAPLGHRYVPRSMPEGRLRGAVCLRARDGLPRVAEAQVFFEEICLSERLTLRPHYLADTIMSVDRGQGCRRQKQGGCPLPLGAGSESYRKFWWT